MPCCSIVPPKKDEPVNKGPKFNRNNSNNLNHSDEKVKIVVKNDQFKKEIKKKYVPSVTRDIFHVASAMFATDD